MVNDISKVSEESEDWFLSAIQQGDTPIESLIEVLERVRKSGQQEKADACVELLQENLVERNDCEAAIELLKVQAGWHEGEEGYAPACKERLDTLFKNVPAVLKNIPHAGFDKQIPPGESLRRLLVLMKLSPGTLCHDKTWGFGVVRELAENLNHVVIDFREKEQHRMSLAYACETLRLLDDKHVLAEQYRDPPAFARLVKEDSAGVVKAFIRDFGPMNAVKLQELIVANVDALQAWKSFWENARKQLKRDPLVVIPAKRNEPIRVLETDAALDDHWIQNLRSERDPERILELIEDWKSTARVSNVTGSVQNAIEERLAFATAAGNNTAPAIRALLLAEELGVRGSDERKETLVARLLDPETLRAAMDALPARYIARLIPFLAERRPAEFKSCMLELIPDLSLQVLNILVDSLLNLGYETDVADTLRNTIRLSGLHTNAACWLCCHLEFMFKNKICPPDKFVFLVLTDLETARVAGKHLQATNKIRASFRKNDWIEAVVAPLDGLQRNDLVLRLKKSPAFQESERNMIVARLMKLFPDLESASQSETPETSNQRFTSLRSYAERQAQLRHLVDVDVPQNIKDIAAARSYGDLSENYEYHSARETQRMLMDRRKELETSLSEVQGTAFENAPCDKAGMGTCVTLRHENGHTERYAILGEWDNDQTLGIISSSSGLARILAGHKTGDEALIPKESGNVRCVVEAVSGLTKEVREWITVHGSQFMVHS